MVIYTTEEKIKQLESKNKSAAQAELKKLDKKCKKMDRDFTNLQLP
jgi:hypothetical protein